MDRSMSKSPTYKDAGIDVDAGNRLVDLIRPIAQTTRRTGSMDRIGGFSGLFDLDAAGLRDPVIVSATDGVGTKLRIAIDTDRLGTVGIDLVAMCVNDLICHGATPLFFLDYLAMGRIDVDAGARIVEGIAAGCRIAGCALLGGESAEMPGFYSGRDFDLAGFAVGAAERGRLLPRGIAKNDVLLGLPSSGLHSNGFSLVRKVVADAGLSWTAPAPAGARGDAGTCTIADIVLEPTAIYAAPVAAAIKAGRINALAHITGGGLTDNVSRILPPGIGAGIDLDCWHCPEPFRWLAGLAGISEAEMLRTFNCGIGMVAAVPDASVVRVREAMAERGVNARPIGRLTTGDGVSYAGSLL